jgi:hypothetical protein
METRTGSPWHMSRSSPQLHVASWFVIHLALCLKDFRPWIPPIHGEMMRPGSRLGLGVKAALEPKMAYAGDLAYAAPPIKASRA